MHDSRPPTELTYGEETLIGGDSGYANEQLRMHCRQAGVCYLITDKAHRNRPLSPRQRHCNAHEASVRGKWEFSFRIIKHFWGHVRVRYLGLFKNPSHMHVLFALSNLYQARRQLLAAA